MVTHKPTGYPTKIGAPYFRYDLNSPILDLLLDPFSRFAYATHVTNLSMETLLQLPGSSEPSTLAEVLNSLKKEHLEPRLESKAWGDWIYLDGYNSVISIESNRGLSSSATIEHADGEEDGEFVQCIHRAFARLGWHGVDEDGVFPL